MSRSEQSRLNEQRQRQAWKKRRDRHRPSSGSAAIPSKAEDRGSAWALPESIVLPNGDVAKVFDTEQLGLPTMSGQIQELIDPFIDMVETKKSFEGLVSLAVAAWNAHILPKEDRLEMLTSAMGALTKDDISAFARTVVAQRDSKSRDDIDSLQANLIENMQQISLLIGMLLDRRRRLFSDDLRFILNYSIDWPNEREPYLCIASSLPPDLDIPDDLKYTQRGKE
jgi:hypothetical protein